MNKNYIITDINEKIILHPSQMNNNILNNLLSNIKNKYENKCYKDYGYISKILDIIEYDKNPILDKEDFSSSAHFDLKFSCEMYNVKKNDTIECEINKIMENMIYCLNGPIHILIKDLNLSINKNNFILDTYKNLWKYKKDNKYLKIQDILIVTITNFQIKNNCKYILCFANIIDKKN